MQQSSTTVAKAPPLRIMNGAQLLRWLGEINHIKPEDRDENGHFDEAKAEASIYADIDREWEAREADPVYVAEREARRAAWQRETEFRAEHGFYASALTQMYDPTTFLPILVYDSTVFTEDETGRVFDHAMATFFDEIGDRFSFHVTATDRETGRTVYERKLSSGFVAVQRFQLTAEVERFITDYDGYVNLTFHAAPLPVDDVALVEDSTGGLLSFLEAVLPELDFVMHGAARGEYGVCVAPPSSYKTTFVQNLCMSLATGRPFEPFTVSEPGEYVETTFNIAVAKPRRVVYLDFENGQSFAQSDLKTMVRGGRFDGAEMALLESNYYPIIDPQVRLGGDPDSDTLACLSDDETVNLIIERINARFGEGQTDIVVIDTQAEGFDLEDENSNGANGAGAIARAVNRIKRQTGAFVLLISHTAKNGEEANQSAERSVRGASRVADKSRFTLKIEQYKDSGGRVVPHHIVVTNVKAKGPKLSDGAKLHFTHDPKTRWMSLEYGGPVAQPQIPYTADSNEPTERDAWIKWRMDTTACDRATARSAWNRKSR